MRKILVFILIFQAFGLWATHNRAGEITYTHLGGNTYEVQITTYTRSCILCADRCELTINWGDGNSEILPRVNGTINQCAPAADGVVIDATNEIRENIYIGQHTYAASGVYILSLEDPNRNAGVNNIINSDQVPFYIESELFIASSLGSNSSPILTNPPVELGCINRRFEHNAGAYDPDGDSLSYELVLCQTTNGDPIVTTYDAQYVTDSIKIDPYTGTLYWDLPRNIGQFNFAFRISEWRKNASGRYTRIGYVIRDMQVDIENCGNNPPEVLPIGPFCVEAGQTLNFNVTANDEDGDDVTLTGFGAPFDIVDPADEFEYSGPEPLTGAFNWETTCNHVRFLPYQVHFKAEDQPDQFETPLSDIYTTEILVVAPAPKNPNTESDEGQITLNWNPSICTDAIGYKIYRRESRYGFFPDECELDVPEYTGYEFLDSNKQGLLDTSYVDADSLEIGVEYCYMVVAYFADESVSYASEEFCASLPLSLPMPIMVDVEETSTTNGVINVAWIAPPELDSSLNPPPYQYVLQRAEGVSGNNFEDIATFNNLTDTSFVDQNLDTETLGYRYRVVFFSGPNVDRVGASSAASSVYLEPTGSDESVELDMRHFTPWLNERFVIFRENPLGSGNFDSIAESYSPFFVDTGLVNGQEYCYRVSSYGRYTASDTLPQPLINRSQIACAIARDTTAPCAPEFDLITKCPDTILFIWNQPLSDNCSNDDIVAYNIYFRPSDGEYSEIPFLTIYSSGNGSYEFINDANRFGCFAITAVDDADQDGIGAANESAFSEEVCLESCFDLEFPNVFTPNDDALNDYFLPIDYNQVDDLRITIYGRWGNKIYEAFSLDAFVNPGWDGTVQASGNPAPEGVYFYVCHYKPKSLENVSEQVASGFVTLLR